MTTMKAWALQGEKKAGFIDAPIPKCGPLDAICRPIALSPCTSDVHNCLDNPGHLPNGVIFGHEAVGEIVEVGELVKDFKKGDKVVVPAITAEWAKVASQEGHHQHCGVMLGAYKFTSKIGGTFAEYFRVIEADANLALLPEGMDPAVACMVTDMVTTGFHGAELANVSFGDSVCVIGIGPVGLMAVRGSVLMGAGRVFAVGTRPNCVAVAKEYGATDIISYKAGSILKQILKATDGVGVDKCIIAGGDVNTFLDAVNMIKPGGVVANINYLSQGTTIPIPVLGWGMGMSHKDIRGGLCPGGRARMQRLLDIVKYGRVDPSRLITHRFEGFEKIEDSFNLMVEKPADLIKPVVLIKY